MSVEDWGCATARVHVDMPDDWPPHVHTGDPFTSHDAAEQLDPTRDVQMIVQFHADHDRPLGWTRWELRQASSALAALDDRNNGLQKRTTDARARGFIERILNRDTGEPLARYSQFHRLQAAMRITEDGRTWLAGGGGPVPKRRQKRQPRALELTKAERKSFDYVLQEYRKVASARGHWVILGEDHLKALLDLLQRLGVKP